MTRTFIMTEVAQTIYDSAFKSYIATFNNLSDAMFRRNAEAIYDKLKKIE